MFRSFSQRNPRTKTFKVKRALQVCVLLGVCIWLVYQFQQSREKKTITSYGENTKTATEAANLENNQSYRDISDEKSRQENEETKEIESENEENEEIFNKNRTEAKENMEGNYEENGKENKDERNAAENDKDEVQDEERKKENSREENYAGDNASSAVGFNKTEQSERKEKENDFELESQKNGTEVTQIDQNESVSNVTKSETVEMTDLNVTTSIQEGVPENVISSNSDLNGNKDSSEEVQFNSSDITSELKKLDESFNSGNSTHSGKLDGSSNSETSDNASDFSNPVKRDSFWKNSVTSENETMESGKENEELAQ